MKVKKESALFSVLMGSHLYGTATPTSDYDYKVVCLPSLDDLLLNKRVTNRKQRPEGLSDSAKMLAGEDETEYVPLQVFLNDFFSGQTYALEMVFACLSDRHEGAGEFAATRTLNAHWAKKLAEELVGKFLTSNVKKMVGYAVSQSQLYGLKTQRFTSVKAFVETVEQHFVPELGAVEANKLMKTQKLQDSPMLVNKLLTLPHVKMSVLANARGGMENAPALDVCGKQFPMTNTWNTVLSSMKGTLSGYGDRVKGFEGEGTDWKALSHALRVTEQVLELCETGKLTFPRPNAEYLLAAKRGELSLEEVQATLERAFNRVDDVVAKSVLPTRTPELEAEFQQWVLSKLHQLYEV